MASNASEPAPTPEATCAPAPEPCCQERRESTCRQEPSGGQPRPRIGLTTYYEEGTWGAWRSIGAIVPAGYVESVADAGGTPVLLPPVATDTGVLDFLDGLIVIGGCDVDPASYGAEPHPKTRFQPARDRHDLALTRAALDRDMPLFAICRGAQVLNVALGGTLIQHLPEVNDHALEHRPDDGVYGTVGYSVEPGSLCQELLGASASSPCHHHQALDRVAEDLTVTARAGDGTIEAVELTAATWVLGVQFHPEENRKDPRLFDGFLQAARQFSGSHHQPTAPTDRNLHTARTTTHNRETTTP